MVGACSPLLVGRRNGRPRSDEISITKRTMKCLRRIRRILITRSEAAISVETRMHFGAATRSASIWCPYGLLLCDYDTAQTGFQQAPSNRRSSLNVLCILTPRNPAAFCINLGSEQEFIAATRRPISGRDLRVKTRSAVTHGVRASPDHAPAKASKTFSAQTLSA